MYLVEKGACRGTTCWRDIYFENDGELKFEFCLAAILATGRSSRRTVYYCLHWLFILMWDGVHTIIFCCGDFRSWSS